MENLKYLKDVISLEKVILGLKQANNEEFKRIEFLEKQKLKKEEEKTQLQDEISEAKESVSNHEKLLFDLDKKLEQNKANLNAVTSQQQEEALKASVDKQEVEFNNLQDQTLILLESIEDKESKLKETSDFINGIKETISEIQIEVEKANQENQSKISDLEVQITGLLKEVPPNAANLYQLASKKRPHDACAFLVGQSCGSCKFTYAAGEVATFNKGIELIQCKGCQRLLLPAPLRNL